MKQARLLVLFDCSGDKHSFAVHSLSAKSNEVKEKERLVAGILLVVYLGIVVFRAATRKARSTISIFQPRVLSDCSNPARFPLFRLCSLPVLAAWHLLHKVIRLSKSLQCESLSGIMWSIASRSVCPQIWHFLPSRALIEAVLAFQSFP